MHHARAWRAAFSAALALFLNACPTTQTAPMGRACGDALGLTRSDGCYGYRACADAVGDAALITLQLCTCVDGELVDCGECREVDGSEWAAPARPGRPPPAYCGGGTRCGPGTRCSTERSTELQACFDGLERLTALQLCRDWSDDASNVGIQRTVLCTHEYEVAAVDQRRAYLDCVDAMITCERWVEPASESDRGGRRVGVRPETNRRVADACRHHLGVAP